MFINEMFHHLALLLSYGNTLVFTSIQIISADEIGISDQIGFVVKGVAPEKMYLVLSLFSY